MSALRLPRRLAFALALLALVAAAALPTLSRLSVVGGLQAAAIEVCTASGVAWIAADAGTSKPAQPAGDPRPPGAGDACPWCQLHADAALPPAALAALRPLAPRAGPPSSFYREPRRSFAWAPAQSRAPPRLS